METVTLIFDNEIKKTVDIGGKIIVGVIISTEVDLGISTFLSITAAPSEGTESVISNITTDVYHLNQFPSMKEVVLRFDDNVSGPVTLMLEPPVRPSSYIELTYNNERNQTIDLKGRRVAAIIVADDFDIKEASQFDIFPADYNVTSSNAPTTWYDVGCTYYNLEYPKLGNSIIGFDEPVTGTLTLIIE